MASVEAARGSDRAKLLTVLAKTVATGNYRVAAEFVADAILEAAGRRGGDG